MATHGVPVGTSYVSMFPGAAYDDVVPGDIIELAPGVRGTCSFKDIQGTALNPITIQNGNGVVDLDTAAGWVGFYFYNCKYVRVTGSAYGQTYGIKISNCVGFGILGELKTDNIEIDHIELNHVTGDGIGIRIKADYTAAPDYDYDQDGDIDAADGTLDRASYTMENVKIHDCYCDGGLGVNGIQMFCYVSCSNYCEDPDQPASENIEVYNNYIANTGHKALQVGSVISGLKVYDNVLVNCDMVAAEAIAMNINAGIGGEVYNNWFHNCPSAGIYWQTAGGKIYNNVFIDCGRNSGTYGSAIVVDYRAGYNHAEDLQILNNTIIRPLHYGVNLVDNYGVITVQNNIIADPGTDYINGVPDVESNNLEVLNIVDCGFTDEAADDYTLAVGSAAIDTGHDVSDYGITFDKQNDPRPIPAAGDYDIGAYEFQGEEEPPPPPPAPPGGGGAGGTSGGGPVDVSVGDVVEIYLCTPEGVRVECLDYITAYEYAHIANEPGPFRLMLPAKFDRSKIKLDNIVEIWRGCGPGTLKLDYCGFLRAWVFGDDAGNEYTELYGLSPMELLKRRVVAYYSDWPQADMTDQADDMIKEIAKDNLGTDTTSPRELTSVGGGFTIAANLADGYSIDKVMSFRNVLEVCQEICESSAQYGTEVYFDVVPVISSSVTGMISFQLKTFTDQRGNDRTWDSINPLFVGPTWGNLENGMMEYDYIDEINAAYVLGRGEGSARDVYTGTDATRTGMSIWNRREGSGTSDAQYGDDNALAGDGYAYLQENRPKFRFSGDIVATTMFRYGKHWGFGDMVTAVYAGMQLDAMIKQVVIRRDSDGQESIIARLEISE